MKITRRFTTAGQDPFASVKWVKRSSKITNPDGSIVFQMDDAEVPETWSQLATDIMVSKYFRKAGVPQADGSKGPEKSARQVIHRLAGCWRYWGEKHGYFDTPNDAQAFYDELAYMMTHQMAAPNSPQWFNTGLNWAYGISGPAQGHWVPDPKTGKVGLASDAYSNPQPHACFIQSVSDDLVNEGGIMDLWVREARLFKYGSGTGTNFSHLRAENESLSGGGKSSGLMSWLRIGDRAAGAIKSGGTTRRAAKMVCLDMDHPDIEKFVNWKVREEIKVQAMVEGLKVIAGKTAGRGDSETIGETARRLGLKLDYDFNGEAYATVSGQNSNNSVRMPDEFFDALKEDADWQTYRRVDGKPAAKFKAKSLWDQIGYAAWRCADPGVQFDSTINAWHTCPGAGRINASNPCVTGDTLVATSTGYRRIVDLVGKRVEVIDGHGEKSLVEKVFKTGHKDVYELKTRSGYTLKLTADHQVLTANRGDVPACELTRDDVVILKGAGFGDDFVPAQFGEVVGAALGDGCITRGEDQDHLFISLASEERGVAAELHECVEHCKQWLFTGDERGSRQTGVVQTQTGVRVGTSVRAVVERISEYAVVDEGSERKRLRDRVFGLDKASQAAILRGLFTTDGTVANYGEKSQYVSLDSTSLELLRQAQMLLLSFGIKAKLYENRRAMGSTTAMLPDGKGGMREYPVQQMHSLRISRSSRVVFEHEIGFMKSSAKGSRLAELNRTVETYSDKMFDEVETLRHVGMEDVFDLTEPRTHHFVAGGMVVHNCSEYMFLDNTACNLASLNVLKFYDPVDRVFDIDAYEHATDLWTVVLEISVLMASYPSKEVAELSWKYRTLGLGYANLGAMLMQAGIPYDSQEARVVCACLTSILTGRSYRMSAMMAAQLGAFPGYQPEKENMLRVIRNHRLAAHGVPRSAENYEGLRIPPMPIDHEVINAGRVNLANAEDLLDHSTRAWDEALGLGDRFGYRNAQVTVIAPTGTIGLLMDCDTTGIEPDFALVKFKKLAGGGYFKIANASVEPALVALGYGEEEVKGILEYLLGTLNADVMMPGGGGTFKSWLMGKGFSQGDIDRLNEALPGVFELSFAFNAWTLGDECLERCGIDAAKAKSDPGFSMLRELGLSKQEISELNDVICGTQTIEGAPGLREEHLAVFDCANKCGKYGKRFIEPQGHIRMMAAAQPFISGAISKTINLPNDASVEDIKDCYLLSWELGLKANALYRDGCKLSQPLSVSSDEKEEEGKESEVKGSAVPFVEAKPGTGGDSREGSARTAAGTPVISTTGVSAEAAGKIVDQVHEVVVEKTIERIVEKVVERPMRRRLPETRASITHKFNIAGHEGYLTVGLYEDGMPGELFITMAKEGSTIGGLMDSLGTAVSVALQYGVPVQSLVNKFTHQRFEPAGMTTNRDIPFAKSLVDYIFRWMGMEFIPGYREVNAPQRAENGSGGYSGNGPAGQEMENRRREVLDLDRGGESVPGLDDSGDWSAEAVVAQRNVVSGGPKSGGVQPRGQAAVVTRSIAIGAVRSGGTAAVVSVLSQAASQAQADAPACDSCGSITVRSGTCYKCLNCGQSMGCS